MLQQAFDDAMQEGCGIGRLTRLPLSEEPSAYPVKEETAA